MLKYFYIYKIYNILYGPWEPIGLAGAMPLVAAVFPNSPAPKRADHPFFGAVLRAAISPIGKFACARSTGPPLSLFVIIYGRIATIRAHFHSNVTKCHYF